MRASARTDEGGFAPQPPNGTGFATRQDPGSSAGKKQPQARRCPTCEQAFSGEARFCPFDGDALVDAPDWNPSADPLIGRVIDGRYEVLSVLGEGGMGTVYEVRHTALGRHFALKVLRRDIADAEHTARFILEAKVAAAIGHPNIVAVSDFGELAIHDTLRPPSHRPPPLRSPSPLPPKASRPPPPNPSGPPGAARPAGSVPYFVMEYLSGVSLAALLRAEKPLEPARAAAIVLQCAAGLAAAHAAGVVHRDLKPDNIFLTRSADREFVKLLDFGVAKMVGAGRLTRAGMVFGTPHYMSPEQAAGQSVDHRADIYALGVILYECLAGRVPFEADTYMGVLTKHMFATPEPIERVVPDASSLGTLGPVVMRCLAKSPHDRYASMAEVVDAIEQTLYGAGIPRPRSDRPRASLRRPSEVTEPIVTPGLRPVVGRVGLGLGALALALVVVLGVHELRGMHVEVGTPPSATAAVPPVATSPAVVRAAPTVPPAPTPPPVVPIALPTIPETVAPAPAPSPAATETSEPPVRPVSTTPSRPSPAARQGAGRKKSGKSGDVLDPWNK